MSLFSPEPSDSEMSLPLDRLYTRDHAWLKLNEDTDVYEVGVCPQFFHDLDDGELIYAEFPTGGDQVSFGECCVALESVKAAKDVVCPITGTVDEHNFDAEDEPQTIFESPFETWLYAVLVEDEASEHLTRLQEQGELLTAVEYKTLLDLEARSRDRRV